MPSHLLMRESKTAPPELLTEADLIQKMDRNGIGTDATIAQHIQTIKDREYVVGWLRSGSSLACSVRHSLLPIVCLCLFFLFTIASLA